MIEVLIWTFRGKHDRWGHAALRCGTTYVSWWPEPYGRVPYRAAELTSRYPADWPGAGLLSGLRSLYSVSPIRDRSYLHDVAEEGGPPDHVVRIEGLDEVALESWWMGFSLDGGRVPGPLPPWDTLELNCSTVVARALDVAGGSRLAPWTHTWNMVWAPDDVLRYAESIRRALEAGRTP
ncbi:MAG: hypothetical protein IPM29_04480 [Planctomycetes bacterium]|nr:hypothetical protein [Planctomycetota bacterium]